MRSIFVAQFWPLNIIFVRASFVSGLRAADRNIMIALKRALKNRSIALAGLSSTNFRTGFFVKNPPIRHPDRRLDTPGTYW